MVETRKPRLRAEVGAEREERFSAWTGAVRASVEAVERLADEALEKERMLRGLLRGPAPDAAAIGALVIELDACSKKIERIRRTTRASFRRTRPSSPPASLVERSTAVS